MHFCIAKVYTALCSIFLFTELHFVFLFLHFSTLHFASSLEVQLQFFSAHLDLEQLQMEMHCKSALIRFPNPLATEHSWQLGNLTITAHACTAELCILDSKLAQLALHTLYVTHIAHLSWKSTHCRMHCKNYIHTAALLKMNRMQSSECTAVHSAANLENGCNAHMHTYVSVTHSLGTLHAQCKPLLKMAAVCRMRCTAHCTVHAHCTHIASLF